MKPGKDPFKTVISASRRTDIPAFYLDWFMAQIRRGHFEVVNPYNRRVSMVDARPERVHTIVFWSKNFGPFLKSDVGETLTALGYHLFFNFTVNSTAPLLEPCVPPLDERLRQLDDLCRRFDPLMVNWRFDPICFFKTPERDENDNLADFATIARHAAAAGIRRCVTSFVDLYPKIARRAAGPADPVFYDIPTERRRQIVLEMETHLAGLGIDLFLCCEKELLDSLPPESAVAKSSCIPNDLLVERYGGRLSLKQDPGQRRSAGCGCKVSVDIGSYHLQPCYHNCRFCYANPSPDFSKIISKSVDDPIGFEGPRGQGSE